MLFAAASTGGAYNSGSRGAYGRLAAWQSFGALAGCPEGAPFAEVEARAADCTWYEFEADTKWFEQAAWDVGLAALTPDRGLPGGRPGRATPRVGCRSGQRRCGGRGAGRGSGGGISDPVRNHTVRSRRSAARR
ncbi:DUF6183 family protein [Streptomyces xanthochromogenes]